MSKFVSMILIMNWIYRYINPHPPILSFNSLFRRTIQQFSMSMTLHFTISPIHKYINILHIKSTLFVRRISLHSLETIKSHLQNHKIQFIIIIFQISSLVNLSSAIFTVQICFMSLYISIVSLIDRTPDMNISYRDQFIRKFVCKEFSIVLNRFVSKRSLL